MSYLAKSQKRVQGALNIFNKAIDQMVKANKILEQGIEATKEKHDRTCDDILKLETRLDEFGASIIDHEREIRKNVEIIARFKEFTR